MRRRLVPDLVNLQAFESAARHQNFSRAAQELSLTQSAVSRQVADLEKQTGLKLFERIRKRVVLSQAGRRLLPEVKNLLLQSEQLMIGAVAVGTNKASLRIATLPTFGAKWLVPRLGDFLAEHEDVAITMESRTEPFSFVDDSFDLAIHFGQPIWAGGIATYLFRETVLPVASPSLAARLRICAAADVSAAPLLHLISRPKLWTEWFQSQGVPVENAFIGPRLDQFSMILAAAISGIGVALLPTYLMEAELRDGDLVPLVDAPMSTENAYYIVRPEDGQGADVPGLFQEWLLAQMECAPP